MKALQVLSINQINKNFINEYLKLICDWERIAYGENLHRHPAQLLEWIHVNGSGFLCCVDNGETLLGYADLWAIEDTLYDSLKAGLTLEEEVPSSSLLDPHQTLTAKNWYIGSIITDPHLRDHSPETSRNAFRAIRYGMSNYFAKLYTYPAEVLGVGSSKKGQDILTRWNFKPVDMAPHPVDTRPRYRLTLNSAEDALFFRG